MADPTNVGASNTTPQPSGSEVTNNPSAVQPSSAGASATTNASSSVAPVSQAVATYQSSLESLMVGLKPSLLDLPPNQSVRVARVGATDKQVIALAVAMLRTDPTLSGSVTADDLEAEVADADACSGLVRYMGPVMTQVANTGRLRLQSASQATTEIVAVARQRAPRNNVLAQDVAAVDALRATGNAADKAEQVATVKQQRATKATARATKANQESATATARADALQHGTGDATVTQPAPSAPAPTVAAAASTTIR